MSDLIDGALRALLRARDGLARHGLAGFAQRAVSRSAGLIHLREEHVWYELQLAALPRAPALEDPLRLVVASGDELDAVERVGQSAATARERTAAGHEQMMLFDGDELVFSCCVFRRFVPVLAAPRGELRLPEDAVCMEDAITAPAYRRRRLGSVGAAAVLQRLRAEGIHSVLTKIAADNEVARAAALSVGFREIASVRLERLGPRKRVEVEVLHDAPMGAQLARNLT